METVIINKEHFRIKSYEVQIGHRNVFAYDYMKPVVQIKGSKNIIPFYIANFKLKGELDLALKKRMRDALDLVNGIEKDIPSHELNAFTLFLGKKDFRQKKLSNNYYLEANFEDVILHLEKITWLP